MISMNKYIAALAAAGTLMAGNATAQTPGWVSLSTVNAGLDTATAFSLFVSDINNDGYPDFLSMKGNWAVGAQDAIRVYINVRDSGSSNPGARMFVDVTTGSRVNAMPAAADVSRGTLSVVIGDVNNDGYVDIVRGNYYHRLEQFTDHGDRCAVLLGDGMGHFTLVPDAIQGFGLVNTTGFSMLDYDRDGNIDLFVSTWFKDYQNDVWDHGYLLKGNGDGTFVNVTDQAGLSSQPEPMYGCSVVDWNNDGWPDIATGPYCRTNGQLWKNNGNGTFTNVAASAGYNARYMQGDNGQNMCLWSPVPEDFDNDGDMDFFFTLVHGGNDANEGRSAIMHNGGPEQRYRLTADRSLLTKKFPYSAHNGDYDASWMDLDNDGRMELVMVQGTYTPATDRMFMFYQHQDNTFTDITGDLGMIRAETKDLHSLEALDYDMDGDDDLLFCRNGLPRALHLIENKKGQDNNWTGVHLRAPHGVNGSCIGARIHVWSGGKQRIREVYAGRGNGAGQQPFALLFGLGATGSIDSITVSWPDAAGSKTIVRNPPVNRYLEIGADGLAVKEQEEAATQPTLKLYPNPAGDFILVQVNRSMTAARIEIFDAAGRMVQSIGEIAGGEYTHFVNVSGLPAGQYFIKVSTSQGQVLPGTFIRM